MSSVQERGSVLGDPSGRALLHSLALRTSCFISQKRDGNSDQPKGGSDAGSTGRGVGTLHVGYAYSGVSFRFMKEHSGTCYNMEEP